MSDDNLTPDKLKALQGRAHAIRDSFIENSTENFMMGGRNVLIAPIGASLPQFGDLKVIESDLVKGNDVYLMKLPEPKFELKMEMSETDQFGKELLDSWFSSGLGVRRLGLQIPGRPTLWFDGMVTEPVPPKVDTKKIYNRFLAIWRSGCVSPKRALYQALGSPEGKNRKTMKRWLRRFKHIDLEVVFTHEDHKKLL